MAYYLNAGDVVKGVIKFTNDYGSLIENVFHWVVDGPESIDGGAVGEAIRQKLDAAYTYIDDYIHTAVQFYALTVDLIEFFSSPTPHWEATAHLADAIELDTFTPANSVDPLPAQTAFMLRFLTGIPKHEKRTYLAGFTEQRNQTAGKPDATLTAAMVPLAAELYDVATISGSADELIPVVPDVNQEIYREYTGVIIPATWYTQRRRRLLVGI